MSARRLLTHVLIIFALLHWAGYSYANTNAPTEADVKAAAVYNLPLFVEWPAEKLNVAPTIFNVCLLGQVSYQRELHVLEELKILHRPIEVRTVRREADYHSCAIVVVGTLLPSELEIAIPVLNEHNVLTVGNRDKGEHNGLIINLRIEDDRLKIDVNLQAAQRAQITIRSQLLGIANLVEDEAAPN